MDKVEITWQVLASHVEGLASRLPRRPALWGVARGGLLVAIMLNYLREDSILSLGATPHSGDIIVEDIVDTGRTIERYTRKFEIATLYVRQPVTRLCTHFVEVIEHGAWLKFPYEA